MTVRVDESGAQGWAGECGTQRSESADRVVASRGYRDLEAPARAVVDALLDAAGDDRDLCDGAHDLLQSRGFGTLEDGDQQSMLLALADHADGATADRLRHLAADPAFRAVPRDEQITSAAEGRSVSMAEVLGSSGARGRDGRHAGLGPLGVGVHAFESLAEGLHAVAPATAAAAGGLVLLGYEMYHGIHEAYAEGREWGGRVQFGAGFARGMGDLLGGDTFAPRTRAEAEGAHVAEQVWDSLEPSERATLLALSEADRTALVTQLRLGMERLTIGGR